MTHFVYTAEKNDGEVYSGQADARDRFELYEIIRREGGRVKSVKEEAHGGMWNVEYWNLKMTRVKDYDKILLARNLGAMLSAGLPLPRAFAVLERQTKNIKLARTIAAISDSIRRGDPLNIALAKFPEIFSELFVAMVRAGEESGELPASLLVVADQTEQSYELKRKIKSAMIYPCIILIAIVGIGAVLMVTVVPTLAATFAASHATLPMSTQIIIGISNVLKQYTIFVLIGVITLIVLINAILRTHNGKRGRDFLILHLPVIKDLICEINAARTARTLSSLRSSGVDVIASLEITHDVVQNLYFRDVLKAAQVAVRGGQQLSTIFAQHENLYPPFVGEMMAVGEETGTTNDMLKRLALYYEDQVDRKTKDMSTIIEPFLMLFIGVVVGFFAVSMIAPIYQMTSNIS